MDFHELHGRGLLNEEDETGRVVEPHHDRNVIPEGDTGEPIAETTEAETPEGQTRRIDCDSQLTAPD